MHGLSLAAVAVVSFWFFNDNWLASFPHGWFDNVFWRMNQP